MALTPKQLKVFETIREYVEEHAYAPTLAELSEILSVSTVTAFEHLRALEKKGYIRREKHKTRAIEICVHDVSRPTVRSLPLLGTIAAGRPIEALPSHDDVDLADFVGATPGRDLFLLAVRGDSMIDEHIRDGDYVIVEKRDSATSGETVVALIDGTEATLKKFYHDVGRVRLQPANPTMEPLFIEPDRLRIQGVVIGVLRKY